MKKLLSKITVLVVALALVFSLAACGNNDDNKGNDGDENKKSPIVTSQLLDDSVNAMLDKSGLALNGEVTVNFNSEIVKAIDMDFDAVFNKTDNDYNYKFIAKMGTEEMANMIKVGKVQYDYEDYVNDHVTPAKREQYWYTDFAEPLRPEMLKDNIAQYVSLLKGVPNKAENGGYVISTSENYAPTVTQLTTEVAANKDKSLAEYLAAKFGDENYSAEKLTQDLETVLADGNTVAHAFNKVDAMLTNMGVSGVTAKSLINSVAQEAELTAQDIYDTLPENSVPAPAAGQSVYDYIVSEQMLGAMPIESLVAMFTGGEASLAEFRAMIVNILETATVGAMWNNYVSDHEDEYGNKSGLDSTIVEGLELLGVSDEVLADLTADDKAVLNADNLSKLTFNKISLNIKVEFNGDKTLKSVGGKIALDVDYKADENAQAVKLANIEIEGEFKIDYNNVATVVAPTIGDIRPHLKTSYKLSEFKGTFEYFAGSYTDVTAYYSMGVDDDGNPVEVPVAAADGKITLTEEQYNYFKTSIENGSYLGIYVEFKDPKHDVEWNHNPIWIGISSDSEVAE